MSKIKKVTIEFNDVTYVAEGKDAESWEARISTLETLGYAHGLKNEFKWTKIIKKDDK